jgi:hypothetical protein
MQKQAIGEPCSLSIECTSNNCDAKTCKYLTPLAAATDALLLAMREYEDASTNLYKTEQETIEWKSANVIVENKKREFNSARLLQQIYISRDT